LRETGNRPRITSKTFNAMDDGADFGLARDRVLRQVGTSLERLGIERIDLYLTHEPDPETPVEETFATFAALLERGTIGAWGISNVAAQDVRAWLELGTPALVQNSYSLLDRSDEAEVIPLCAEHGIAYQAFSPLAGGWLTGKYRRGEEAPAGSRMTMRPEPYRHLENDQVFDALEGLEHSATERGVSTAGLALAWALGGTSSVVTGPRRPEHLEPVREALALSLPPDERHEVGSAFPC
jgi:aryl-alcohol dehydrogenase-like predicted oxidoreductase